ncbi:hypothetical protein [Paraburkholderia aromaticivorans]|uniref:hypothetical protein n=1 Tax=Paraburkholderia aromaticivorans TaxID=2026199 RepID=UPI0012FE084E|nr:hypothetical protein [Paraburkholderia aromaticivorans]
MDAVKKARVNLLLIDRDMLAPLIPVQSMRSLRMVSRGDRHGSNVGGPIAGYANPAWEANAE